MLILTRKAGESIMIGEDVEIIFLQSKKGSSRVGIDAPDHIAVNRLEIYNSKRGITE
jgi:carbon storage regulator